jgi:hypothetical protein
MASMWTTRISPAAMPNDKSTQTPAPSTRTELELQGLAIANSVRSANGWAPPKMRRPV